MSQVCPVTVFTARGVTLGESARTQENSIGWSKEGIVSTSPMPWVTSFVNIVPVSVLLNYTWTRPHVQVLPGLQCKIPFSFWVVVGV